MDIIMIPVEGAEVAIKERIASHLQELMLKTELDGWEHTIAFHGIWLDQLEQGRCTWMDHEEKLILEGTGLAPSQFSPSHATTARTSPRTRHCKNLGSYNTPVRPRTKACKDCNHAGTIEKSSTHVNQQHICVYCLMAATSTPVN